MAEAEPAAAERLPLRCAAEGEGLSRRMGNWRKRGSGGQRWRRCSLQTSRIFEECPSDLNVFASYIMVLCMRVECTLASVLLLLSMGGKPAVGGEGRRRRQCNFVAGAAPPLGHAFHRS